MLHKAGKYFFCFIPARVKMQSAHFSSKPMSCMWSTSWILLPMLTTPSSARTSTLTWEISRKRFFNSGLFNTNGFWISRIVLFVWGKGEVTNIWPVVCTVLSNCPDSTEHPHPQYCCFISWRCFVHKIWFPLTKRREINQRKLEPSWSIYLFVLFLHKNCSALQGLWGATAQKIIYIEL